MLVDVELGQLVAKIHDPSRVAAEQDCCQFFRFAITVDTRGVALDVRAPADAFEIVESMFGTAS